MSRSTDVSTKIFYVVLCGVAMLIGAMFFSADLQKVMMSRFHWHDSSFARWSFLQFVPSMYNFSNHIELTPGLPFRQINHFPAREVTFSPDIRQIIVKSGQDFKFKLSSSYRGQTMTTVYDLSVQPPTMVFHYVE